MTDTHTTSHIPDEAVKAAQIKFYEVADYHPTSIDMRKALEAALPHLAPCAVEASDVAILQRIAGYADQYDVPDENGAWPDIQDAMVTVGDLRALRRILSCAITKPVDVPALIKAVRSGERDGFINVGQEPHGNDADLSCPCCGGSGHKDDAKPVDVAAVRRQAHEEAAELLDQGFDMPVEKAWRNDGQPSKNDKCPHDKFMYEDCMICASAAIRALSAEPVQREQWEPTHRHVKRGTAYQLIGTGKMQAENWATYSDENGYENADMQEVAIYRGDDSKLWVRPIAEFNDGRFVDLPAAPTTEAGR